MHLVEREDRHSHAHAILRVAGLVEIGRTAIDAAQPQRLREGRAGDTRSLVAHQLLARQQQQARLAFHLVAIPAFEAVATAHIGRQLRVVERVDELVVYQHVLPTRLVLEFFDLRDQLAVRVDERQLGLPFARHQRLANEDLARGSRIDVAEVHALVAVDDDAVERRAFERDHLGGLLLPVRFEQLRLDHMRRDARQPLRLDRGDAAAEQARRLDQLGRDDPAPRLLGQVRARVLVEADAARAEVPVFVLALQPDVAEQAGEHREVDLLVGRGGAVEPPLVFCHHGVQLRMDIAPLAHAARRDEVVAQQLFLLALRDLVNT